MLGGASAAWPLGAYSQQERAHRVVFLHPYAEDDPEDDGDCLEDRRAHRFFWWNAGLFPRLPPAMPALTSSSYGRAAARFGILAAPHDVPTLPAAEPVRPF